MHCAARFALLWGKLGGNVPYAVVGLITLILWIYCLVDAITCPENEVRNLPKVAWILIILFVPTVGSIIWLVAGRPITAHRPASNTRFAEYDRPGRQVAQHPDDDEAYLRGLRERATQQRREAQRQEEQRQRDLERRRDAGEL